MGLGASGVVGGVVNLIRDRAKESAGNFEAAIVHVKASAKQTLPVAANNDGPAIPPRDATPAQVADWWAGLTQEQRDDLINENYAELGMLRGLPAADIDAINRKRLEEDKTNLEEELRLVNLAISGQMHTPSGKVDPGLYERRAELQNSLDNVNAIDLEMDKRDKAEKEQKGPHAYLLTYAYQGDGRFAVSLGDPDIAADTAVYIPGSGHDVKHERGPLPPVDEGMRLYDRMDARSEDSVAVIVWMGTDMPDQGLPDGLNPTYGDSEHGARRLRDDIAGYQAAADQAGGGAHMTIVAHSYASYMTGEAIKIGMEVDDFVSVGSPGVDAENAGELGMANEHVWAGAAEDDFIANYRLEWLNPFAPDEIAYHGTAPTEDEFGATVFATSDTKEHGEYFNEGSQSLENIARIALGQYGSVERRPPD